VVEAIAKIKTALASQLETGKLTAIEVGDRMNSTGTAPQMSCVGIFAQDSTFDDWMEKLAVIRRNANTAEEIE